MKGFSLVAAASLFPALALAHHGWSEYDSSKLLKLKGKILESGYERPHGFVKLETPGKTWRVVLASPSRMEFRGLAKALLMPGEEAIVEGYPNRRKPEELRAERIFIGGGGAALR